MRKRELRRRVMLAARMRCDGRWIDVSIRNLSSRGMMIESEHAVDRGAYVEIRRGRHVVIGRAAWRQDNQFGLQAQDRIDLDALVARPGEPVGLQPNGHGERRHHARTMVAADRSARHGRHLQTAGLGLAIAVAACLIGTGAYKTLANPLSQISAALIAEERPFTLIEH